ncbi:MAG: FAD-dependent oxidoreductase, partial [Bacteroidota bacterium]
MNHDPSVLVIGGGVIGLATAWRLAQRGHAVTLLERNRIGRGTSWDAAGMLAPAAELGFEELDLYALGRESLRRWPDFARQLEAATGLSVGYRDDGTLVVADDRDSAA